MENQMKTVHVISHNTSMHAEENQLKCLIQLYLADILH